MLRWRLLSTAILVGILSALVWADLTLGSENSLSRPGLCLAPLALLAAALGAFELSELFRAGGLKTNPLACVVGALLTLGFAFAPILWADYPADCYIGKNGWLGFGFAAGIGFVFISEMWRFRQPGHSVMRIALAVFVMGYLGVLMSFLGWLRFFYDNGWGMVALLSMVAVVKVSDSGAYAIGKSMGRHKLAPILSPGKTIEGMFGAFAGGILASWFSFQVLAPWLTGDKDFEASWISIIAYGLIVTTAGMLGDLAESLIKRDMKQKDASHLMPGLGGVLDVFDSVLAAAPAAYVCWVLGLVGPG